MSTFEFGAGLLVLAAVVGVVDDRTLRLPRSVALLLASFPKLPPARCDADSCRSLQRRRGFQFPPVPLKRAPCPGPTARHPCICERLRWPVARLWGAAYRGDRAGGARLYKLPCSISSSAPAMTLSGIELSANGSIRPLAAIGPSGSLEAFSPRRLLALSSSSLTTDGKQPFALESHHGQSTIECKKPQSMRHIF